jgi:hypothetical protein
LRKQCAVLDSVCQSAFARETGNPTLNPAPHCAAFTDNRAHFETIRQQFPGERNIGRP